MKWKRNSQETIHSVAETVEVVESAQEIQERASKARLGLLERQFARKAQALLKSDMVDTITDWAPVVSAFKAMGEAVRGLKFKDGRALSKADRVISLSIGLSSIAGWLAGGTGNSREAAMAGVAAVGATGVKFFKERFQNKDQFIDAVLSLSDRFRDELVMLRIEDDARSLSQEAYGNA